MARKKIHAIHCITGKPVELSVVRGQIEQMKSVARMPARKWYIGPGLTDLQVNGFDGVDFNSGLLSVDAMRHVTDALAATGVTKYFPTVITNDRENMEALLRQIDRVCREAPGLGQSIPGIHLEGPFISQEDGARGAHDRRYVVAPDFRLFEKLQKAAGGRIRIITMSPEWPHADAFIRRCVRSGVLVSIGHTVATPDQIRRAVAAGAKLCTHLGNGAPLMLPRHPNFLWEQLASDELTATLIADGYHVPAAFIKTVLRAMAGRVLLVSDATMFAGRPAGVYDTHIGGTVSLDRYGRLSLASDPRMLAGAASPLIAGVEYLVRNRLATLREAWAMASKRADHLLALNSPTIRRAAGSDWVIFKHMKGRLFVRTVFKSGRIAFPK